MVYLDYNATTPVAPEVLEAMLPFLQGEFGNPSSAHRIGRSAKRAIDQAREQVAELVHCQPSEIIFTGSGTEANNLALFGQNLDPSRPIVCSNIEHSAMAVPVASLQQQGYQVAYIQTNPSGVVALDEHNQNQVSADCQWFGLMRANNETGALQDVRAWADWIKSQSDAHVHSDAIQACGKIALDFAALNVDSMSLSAHKLYAPKGVGALVVKAGKLAKPYLMGGAQELGMRAGTYNVASIVAFGAAAALAKTELAKRVQLATELQQRLRAALAYNPQFEFFTSSEHILPNTALLQLKGMTGATLAIKLDCRGIAVGTGAACSNSEVMGVGDARAPLYNGTANKILMAMQVPEDVSRGALRVSFGRDSSVADIDALVAALNEISQGLPSL